MADHIGYDAEAWVERLNELNKTSKFTASQRAFITARLSQLLSDLAKPIPFVEGP